MLYSKTAQAFIWTAERLADESPKIYFWTLTFKEVPIDDETAMQEWAMLVRRLEHHFPSLQGVRVCELHRSHGIHFHAIVNERLPIRQVFAISEGSGRINGRNRYLDFGRMSADECDKNAIGYLAKYLTKQYRADNNFGQRRRWGCIGGFKPTRCRDVVFETDATRNRERLYGKAQCSFVALKMIQHCTNIWGLVDDWPLPYRVLVLRTQKRVEGKVSAKTLDEVLAGFTAKFEAAQKKAIHSPAPPGETR